MLHGPSYPSSTTLEPTPQAFILNLICSTEMSQPEFKSYDGAEAIVEWSAPSGCSFGAPSEGDNKTPEKKVETVGSGIGWFFILFVFSFATKYGQPLTWTTPRLCTTFATYFALGAYYNYTTYGATGVDLIPCVSSLLFTDSILKYSSLAVDIEISGARCPTCYEMLSLTFVVLSHHDRAQVGEDIWRYNSRFCATFPWIIVSELCEQGLTALPQVLSPNRSTACRIRPFGNHCLQEACS